MADDAKTPAKEADKKPAEATKAAAPKADKKEETKAPAKVSKNLQSIIDTVEKLTVLELADLVKALEDKFGVSAASPMMMAAGAPGGASGGADAPAAEEKTEFDVVLAAPGANKIAVIKAVREINQNLGLKEAKDLVEATPKTLLEGAKKEDAESAKKKLEEAGAQVELK